MTTGAINGGNDKKAIDDCTYQTDLNDGNEKKT
jgi:hypothetical protein